MQKAHYHVRDFSYSGPLLKIVKYRMLLIFLKRGETILLLPNVFFYAAFYVSVAKHSCLEPKVFLPFFGASGTCLLLEEMCPGPLVRNEPRFPGTEKKRAAHPALPIRTRRKITTTMS